MPDTVTSQNIALSPESPCIYFFKNFVVLIPCIFYIDHINRLMHEVKHRCHNEEAVQYKGMSIQHTSLGDIVTRLACWIDIPLY
jgi:hypothetical protein